jgi:hypothetical protein
MVAGRAALWYVVQLLLAERRLQLCAQRVEARCCLGTSARARTLVDAPPD